MRPGIRTKIVVFTVITVLVSVAASVTSVSTYLTREYTAALQSRSFAIAGIVRVQLERVLQFGLGVEDLVGFEVQLQSVLRDFEGIKYAMVMDPAGRVLFHNESRLRGTVSTDPDTLAAIRSGREVLRVCDEHAVQDYDVIVPVADITGRHVASVRVGFPLDLIQKQKRIVLATASAIGVGFGALTIVLLLAALSRMVTTPLRKLLFAVEEIRQSGATSAHAVRIDTNDEIGSLAVSFNNMMEELRFTTVSRDYMDSVFDTLLDALIVFDPDLGIRTANNAAARLLGYSPEELAGRTLADVIVDAETVRLFAGSGESFEFDAEGTRETVLAAKDGRRIPVLLSASAMRDHAGQVTSIVCAAKDITDRKRADELREKLIQELQEALANVKELSGLLPICASCKKIRDDKGYWNQIEAYIGTRSKAAFSHGLCPDCIPKYFPDHREKVQPPGPAETA